MSIFICSSSYITANIDEITITFLIDRFKDFQILEGISVRCVAKH